MMHAELPVGAFVAALLSLAPLPWHWRARNVSTISLIVWLFVMNVIAGVNAIIWRDSAIIMATVWCDIATKLQVGATIALPACCLCICIQLEQIASVRMATMSIDYKKRRMVFDACMCWLLPMVYMALHYVVQGHRFDIVEVTGCSANLYVSLPAILIISVPPLVISILMFIYAGLALVHFFKRRLTFGRHLDSSGLTTSRYFRLMCMSIVEMTIGITISSIDTWSNYQYGMRPWTSWADVHSNFSRIDQVPWVEIPQTTRNWTLGLWWTIPISSVIFFAFFSFGEDAVREYRACFMWFRRVVLRQNSKRDHDGMTVLGSTPSLTRFTSRVKSSSAHKDRKFSMSDKTTSSFELSSPTTTTSPTTAAPPTTTASPVTPESPQMPIPILKYKQSAQSLTSKSSMRSFIEPPVFDTCAWESHGSYLPPVPTSPIRSEFDLYSLYTAHPDDDASVIAAPGDHDQHHDQHHDTDLNYTPDIV